MINDFFSFDKGDNVNSVHTTMEDLTGRKKIELEMQNIHDKLEKRVEERTAEISKSNALLRQEVVERKQIEEKLEVKILELEKFEKIAVGRELKMVELKKKIKELEEKLREMKK